MKTVFLRTVKAEDKRTALMSAVHDVTGAGSRLDVDAEDFAAIPGSPFAYWVSPAMRSLFRSNDSVAGRGILTKCGLGTLDDFRFLRTWWEPTHQEAWRHFIKGERSSPWYGSQSMVVSWRREGSELKRFVESKVGSASRKVQAQDFYGRPGVTWSRRPHRRGWFRMAPASAIFADNGPMAFADTKTLSALLPVLNSAVAQMLMQTQMSRGQGDSGQTLTFEVGVVDNLPLPNGVLPQAFAALARRAWSIKRNLDTRTETSHAFVLPALLQVEGETLAFRSAAWSEHVRESNAEVDAIQAEVDERCFELYEIDGEDRRAINEGFGGSPAGAEVSEEEPGEDAETEEEAAAEAGADRTALAAELVAWAAGVAFGRFDVRLATGARALPAEPEPFDPLPVCSPAMLTGEDGLPLARPPAGYPLLFPEGGILVDDPGHPRDLTAAVRAVFETVFGLRADAVWQEAAALLDPRGHDLRSWLASGFFEHHLKRHSKSRRKAPILWQLGVPSGRYSVWCYAHRLTRDSLFAVQNDIVAPKLAHEERRHSSLVTQAGPTPSAHDRVDIATQEAVVDELRALLDEVRRVAPLWNPDLDDGIVLVLAPLWRLVPGHRAWQKELKSRWDELVAGKYDWAHLAMHLWPERVVPKCATDRSLAIAHDLEGIFWIEGADGKWTRRSTPTQPLDELVAERTSPAVKAALASLLEAPGPAGGGGRHARNAGVTA